MRPNQKSRSRLSPLVFRSLGVLAISLMAMTTPLASSTGVPTCEQMCDPIANTDCGPDCSIRNGLLCIPWNTDGWCFDNCEYTWECMEKRNCRGMKSTGQRLECKLQDAVVHW